MDGNLKLYLQSLKFSSFKGCNHTGRGIKGIQLLHRELRFQGMQSYWEKVSRDTIIIQGEGFKGYNHTGRRFKGIQLYWERD